MKTKRIMPLLLSVIMTAGAVTAVPFKASAAELNAPVVSSQSARSSLATPKISKAESVNNGVKISWGRVKVLQGTEFTTKAVRVGEGLQTQPQLHTQTKPFHQAKIIPIP